jgi:fructokinase
MNRIGIDLGGTKIEGVLIDAQANELKRIRASTDSSKGYTAILEKIKDLVEELKGDNKVHRIGVCTPGVIDASTETIKNSNTACLIKKPIKLDLEKLLNQKIKIENDANCFSMAEARSGAGRDYDLVFGVIMGTGVGGGIVINKNIISGNMRIAGEWGHHTLHPKGNLCYCGKRGCVETYISGPALERRWKELTGSTEKLMTIIKSIMQSTSSEARVWKTEFLENFGLALSNVINILDPDIIILGGGVSNIPFLYDEGVQYVYKYVFNNSMDTPIIKNRLGDSAGVFGAAYL